MYIEVIVYSVKMSSTTRTTARGGKVTKGENISKTQKSDKTDTSKAEKNKSGTFRYNFFHVLLVVES